MVSFFGKNAFKLGVTKTLVHHGSGTGMMAGGAAGRRVSECVSRSTAAVGQMVSSTVAQGKDEQKQRLKSIYTPEN